MNTFELTGIDGTNPLGFLAALGAFRVLNEVTPATLRWTQSAGGWTPVLQATAMPPVLALARVMRRRRDSAPLTMADNPQMARSAFRAQTATAREAWFSTVSSSVIAGHSDDLAFISALGNDSIPDTTDKKKVDINADTAFRTMSGSGHQHFLKFMNELCGGTSLRQLREALFGPWRYADTQFSMRWDPADDRRYAMRWDNPSGDPARTVRGANRLAIEALPLFPVMPVSATALGTTGFSGTKASNTFWTWPLWTPSVTLDVCRSLLALGELQEPQPEIGKLAPLGVTAILRSQRLTVGKFRNFTPAKVIAQSLGLFAAVPEGGGEK